MFNPVITSANASQYFAAARRAKTLFSADRYTWDYAETDLDAVAVRSPAYPFGEVNDGEYTVNALTGTCTCPAFAKCGTFCKHVIAVTELLAEEIQWRLICDEVDAQEAA